MVIDIFSHVFCIDKHFETATNSAQHFNATQTWTKETKKKHNKKSWKQKWNKPSTTTQAKWKCVRLDEKFIRKATSSQNHRAAPRSEVVTKWWIISTTHPNKRKKDEKKRNTHLAQGCTWWLGHQSACGQRDSTPPKSEAEKIARNGKWHKWARWNAKQKSKYWNVRIERSVILVYM